MILSKRKIKINKKYYVKKSDTNILSGYNYKEPVEIIKKHTIDDKYYVRYIAVTGHFIENGIVHQDNLIKKAWWKIWI